MRRIFVDMRLIYFNIFIPFIYASGNLMVRISASQLHDRGFEPHIGYDHVSSYDNSTAEL